MTIPEWETAQRKVAQDAVGAYFCLQGGRWSPARKGFAEEIKFDVDHETWVYNFQVRACEGKEEKKGKTLYAKWVKNTWTNRRENVYCTPKK